MTFPIVRSALAAVALLSVATPVLAETGEIRIAQQFGIAYLPLIVMKEQGLIERAVAKAGLPAPKVQWLQISGAATMNDGLLSGSLDYATAGIGPMITLFDRSRSGVKVRGVAALGSMPNYLTTNNPEIRTLSDFRPTDKIALPSAKVGFQAVVLQMAAEQAFGPGQQARLDDLVVSLPHPDATAALLSGSGVITAHFTSPPFQNQQLLDPRIHKVLSSYDVLGGPHTFNVIYATSVFHDANPRTSQAFLAALDQAMDFITGKPEEAAALYIRAENSKLSPDFVTAIIRNPENRFTATPEATLKFAAFQYKVKQIRQPVESWTDLFFPEIHGRQGS